MSDQEEKELFDFCLEFARAVPLIKFSGELSPEEVLKREEGSIHSIKSETYPEFTFDKEKGQQTSIIQNREYKSKNGKWTIILEYKARILTKVGHQSKKVVISSNMQQMGEDAILLLNLWCFCRETEAENKNDRTYNMYADNRAVEMIFKYKPDASPKLIMKGFLKLIENSITEENLKRAKNLFNQLEKKKKLKYATNEDITPTIPNQSTQQNFNEEEVREINYWRSR